MLWLALTRRLLELPRTFPRACHAGLSNRCSGMRAVASVRHHWVDRQHTPVDQRAGWGPKQRGSHWKSGGISSRRQRTVGPWRIPPSCVVVGGDGARASWALGRNACELQSQSSKYHSCIHARPSIAALFSGDNDEGPK